EALEPFSDQIRRRRERSIIELCRIGWRSRSGGVVSRHLDIDVVLEFDALGRPWATRLKGENQLPVFAAAKTSLKTMSLAVSLATSILSSARSATLRAETG